jgi:hypothetical protein
MSLTVESTFKNDKTINTFIIASALCSCLFYLIFDVAAALGMTGILTDKYWKAISWYSPSILLAYSYLIMVVSIHCCMDGKKRFYTLMALCFSVIYVGLNSIVYICQIFVIAPSFIDNTFNTVSMFEVAEGKIFYPINTLAYTLMGISTLFLSFGFTTDKEEKAVKYVLFIHGIVAPAMFGTYIFKPIFIVSSTVGITYPIASILIAKRYRNILKGIL